MTGQATVPAAAAGMPPLAFPMATMMYFQFVFAAITVIILAGSLLGRMNFKAWVIFCPLWMTLVYTVGAFSIWGGGWLAQMGALDFSGGYVIHLAAASHRPLSRPRSSGPGYRRTGIISRPTAF